MKTVRHGLFETNSSSVHSIVYRNQKFEEPKLPINPKTNKVISYYGEFGKEKRNYTTQEEKLSYLLSCIWYTRYSDDMEEDYTFQELEEVVNEHCGTYGIEILSGAEPCIDHQSIPEYEGECSLFVMTKYNMENFIFNPDVMLHTDCD